MDTYTLSKLANRNYPMPGPITESLRQWASKRSTDVEVALAIHALTTTDSGLLADRIWEDPTDAENDWIAGCLNEWCRGEAVEPGTYHWGMEHIEVRAE